MSNLDASEKDLLLEYCLGLSESPERVGRLISSSSEAAEICDRIARVLTPLDSLASVCPDALVRRTLDRLHAAAKSEVAAPAGPKIIRLGWPAKLSSMAGVVTVAACILIIVGVAIPSFSFIRNRYYRQACLSQLDGLYKSIDLYSSDHDGLVPAVARSAGTTWAGVGRQGPGNYSNTRNLFLLAKLNYAKLEDFVCCGPQTGRVRTLTPAQLAAYDDFPARRDVTYSYRLMPNPRTKLSTLASQPLMADMNPHFEKVSPQMDVCPSEKSLCLNSRNHKRQGQNVLWGDGHAQFTSRRTVGGGGDDIYTIADTSTYRGLEWPTDPGDTFIAP